MSRIWSYVILSMAVLWLGAAQAPSPKPPQPQRNFASPEEAVVAFVAALRAHKEADLRAILGPDADRVLNSGDKYADRELHQRFVALYDEKHAINQTSRGARSWTSARTIGRCRSHSARTTGAGPSIPRLARRPSSTGASAGTNCRQSVRCWPVSMPSTIISISPNRQRVAASTHARAQHAGTSRRLYWPVAEGGTESPLGPLINSARDAGYPGELVGGKPVPYEGYNFRILKAQGPHGDGGAKSYIQSGRMIGGFALIAWPAVFESSGIMTFIVGPDGHVYQKDLGPQTAQIVAGMTTFDPDVTWAHVAMTDD